VKFIELLIATLVKAEYLLVKNAESHQTK